MARPPTAADVEVGRASAHALLRWADAEPAGLRLPFRHAAREPEFRAEVDVRAAMVDEVRMRLTGEIAAEPFADWAAQLATAVCLEAIMAWLDAGRPEPTEIADRIDRAVEAAIQAPR
ncbi:hypothetical protein SAMN05216215_1008176 [Saccharopolyspora shandongensis]|uniref:MftR C-terminal domain-containing protein n=1 Tax=Saccharopolyspora shandongensis TaxID=418495 RepID=A0A1H2ZSE7_9PSEU|nr:hypothetical protein [Saccharopolyspora shandongensis]SDX20502.1 hypothetical protein SAMN05216215_1008176 [Saccharopolyspora shandongensis]